MNRTIVFSLVMAIWFGERDLVGQGEQMQAALNAWAAEMQDLSMEDWS